MSTNDVGDSFADGDRFDDMDSSTTGDLFESFENAFLSMDLSDLASKSEKEVSLVVATFIKVFKRVILIGFAILVATTSLHLVNLVFVTPSVYSFYSFFGILFLSGYFYPIRVIYGLMKGRTLFIYLRRRVKYSISALTFSLVIATALGAYPVVRDYLHYFVDSPGTCLMLVDKDESTIYFNNVSCFSHKAFQVIDHKSDLGYECSNSEFGVFDSWAGDFCLIEKRPPSPDEQLILNG